MSALLKFDWVKQATFVGVNLITILRVYKFMVRVRVFRLNLVRNSLVCSLNL
ncbi:hypothetical protein [Campylobacter concisus]|uniref:hypothetical protein n=1 Tax=Campylobacter concisus TaxID=199 RepID=UPI0015E1A48D|nr:hypothetical protein [Campylobacter concisus]